MLTFWFRPFQMIGNAEFGDFLGRVNPNQINNIRFENGHSIPLSIARRLNSIIWTNNIDLRWPHYSPTGEPRLPFPTIGAGSLRAVS